MTGRAAAREASCPAAGDPARTPGDRVRGPITGRGLGTGAAAARGGGRPGTGRDPAVVAPTVGTPAPRRAGAAAADRGEGAAEAWLAVLSLHGDFDDDEWAALCGDVDGPGRGAEAAGARGSTAVVVPPERRAADATRAGTRRPAARASNG